MIPKSKNKAIIISILLLVHTYSDAQGWYKTYDFGGDDYAVTVLNTLNNGYVLVGNRIVRTDSLGNVIWETTPVSSPEHYNAGIAYQRAVSLVDGSFVVLSKKNTSHQLILRKYSSYGFEFWEKPYLIENTTGLYEECIALTSEGGFAMMLNYEDVSADATKIILLKTDSDGEVEWQQKIGTDNNDSDFYEGGSIASLDDGGIVIAGHKDFGTTNSFLYRIDGDGNVLWEKFWSIDANTTARKVLVTKDQNIVVVGMAHNGSDLPRMYMIKFDLDGTELWRKDVMEFGMNWPISMIETADGNFVGAGQGDLETHLFSLDANGNYRWVQTSMPNEDDFFDFQSIVQTPDGGFALGGQIDGSTHDQDMLLMSVDSLGNYFGYHLLGKIFKDEDGDCQLSVNEIGLANRIVKAIGDKVYYGISDENGDYDISAPIGEYELSVHSQPYWENCSDQYHVEINSQIDTAFLDIPQKAAVDCPLLSVDISAPFIRFCSAGYYAVKYCYLGTTALDSTTIDIVLPEQLQFQNATATLNSQNGQTLTFKIGELAVNDCGSFNVYFEVSCDSEVVGQTLCTEAHTYPDTLCGYTWTAAKIELDAYCENDSIQFSITNTGGDMPAPFEYIVIEDNIILMTDEFQLPQNQSVESAVAAKSGATYHLVAAQDPNLPPILGNPVATASVEGCVGIINVGAFNQIPFDDGEPWLSTDCHEVVSSYDPNDKNAFPSGWTEDHLIEAHTDLEYLIRFQNTGTDTAFKVVIVDTLSQFLDPSTIRPGAGSHPFSFGLTGQGVATFTFDNILLPDSTTNEAASHGFVQFSISQKTGNEIGTRIENTGYIYFDYNSAVQTNTVFHTIGDPWVQVVNGSVEVNRPGGQVSVFPNPCYQSATFGIDGFVSSHAVLQLFDVNGKTIFQTKMMDGKATVERGEWPTGIYFFSISEGEKVIASGKLMVR